MPPTKKRKLNEEIGVNVTKDHENVEMEVTPEPDMDEQLSSSSASEETGVSESGSEVSSLDTEAEIEISQRRKKKSKKTAKRKIRATSPSRFGNTLEALLNTSVPTTSTTTAVPLALKPSVQRRIKERKDEYKTKKSVEMEKKEHEEVGRITDVIGGWGGESERALRKVAQRGGEESSFGRLLLTNIQSYNCSMLYKRHRLPRLRKTSPSSV
jgi:hypothetical protein